MRVGIIGLLHESNTFVPSRTGIEEFRRNVLLTGEAVRQRFAGDLHEIGGFFEGLAVAGIEPVPIFVARAMPSGTIAADAFETLMSMMMGALDAAGALDGVLAAPHGATVCESAPDADGYWLTRVRQHLGASIPIIATMDPHGNLSPEMVKATDAIIAYRTNPHVDQKARGLEAAALMARTLRGQVRPTQAAAMLPLAINIERQDTFASPWTDIYANADRVLKSLGVLGNSIALGFPYADVKEMGAACIVVTDNKRELAEICAQQLGREIWMAREALAPRLIGIDEALRRAADLEGPVCLLDMGDNIGGGSPGDGVALPRAMQANGLGPTFVSLHDPVSVDQAVAVGTGGSALFQLGGKSAAVYGPPLELQCRVVGLYDGRFEDPGVTHGGFARFDQGPTAVLRTYTGMTIMLNSHRMAPLSLAQITSCGLSPVHFKLIVAKGVHAPVASYRSVCRHFIRVNTPGFTSADLRGFDYRHRRRPMFPFEPEASWP